MSEAGRLFPRLAARAASFRGRMSRPVFIACQLCFMPLVYIWYRAVALLEDPARVTVFSVLVVVAGFALLSVGLSLFVRRLHDIGLPGWWCPVIVALSTAKAGLSALVIVVFALWPGEEGANRFGAQPRSAARLWRDARLWLLERRYAAGKIPAGEYNAARAALRARD